MPVQPVLRSADPEEEVVVEMQTSEEPEVHRVVAETGGANHAGFSVWADERNVYLNLNQSFIGVSFEAHSGSPAEGYTASVAQLFAARVLTEMLRSKYGIADMNCVTHAQVSVNQQNYRIGYHTDWAGNFPFAAIGLPDNYARPVASMVEFGFEYDSVFLRVMGNRLWPGIEAAEQQLRQQSTANGMPATRWKSILQQRFRNIANQILSNPSPTGQTANTIPGEPSVISR